jgi:hypothetical protein
MEVVGVPGIVNRSSKKIVGCAAGKKNLEEHVQRVQVLMENAHGKDHLVHQQKLCVSFEGESLY